MAAPSGNDNADATTPIQSTESLMADWKECLQSENVNVRLAATKAVLELSHESLAQYFAPERQQPREEQEQSSEFIDLLAKNASFIPLQSRSSNNNGSKDDDDDDEEVEDERISVAALKALVHISSSSSNLLFPFSENTEAGLLDRMLEIALSPIRSTTTTKKAGVVESSEFVQYQRINHALSLVVNLTRSESGAVALVGRQWPDTAVAVSSRAPTLNHNAHTVAPTKPSLELLLARFWRIQPINTTTNGSTRDEVSWQSEDDNNDNFQKDPYQHVAAILWNATQTEAGRAFLMKLQTNQNSLTPLSLSPASTNTTATNTVLQTLMPQLKHSPNPLRRRGLAGTIRNCCHDRDSVWWLVHVVQIHKHILYMLAGPEELTVEEKQGLDPDIWLPGPDKHREPDAGTRQWLVESLLLLLATGGPAVRNTLRIDKTYVILKLADMVEEQESISELIYDCVNYLRRDEHGTAEGSSDVLVDKAYSKLSAATVVLSSNESTAVSLNEQPKVADDVAAAAQNLGNTTLRDDFDNVD